MTRFKWWRKLTGKCWIRIGKYKWMKVPVEKYVVLSLYFIARTEPLEVYADDDSILYVIYGMESY